VDHSSLKKQHARAFRTANAEGKKHKALPITPFVLYSYPHTFLTRPTAVFNREQIMSAAYQLNIQVSDRTIDSHIRNIRAKLAAANCDNVIETIHGVGFKLGRCEPQA